MSGQNNFLEKPEPLFDIWGKIIDEIGKFWNRFSTKISNLISHPEYLKCGTYYNTIACHYWLLEAKQAPRNNVSMLYLLFVYVIFNKRKKNKL